jgi:hypothetical protein
MILFASPDDPPLTDFELETGAESPSLQTLTEMDIIASFHKDPFFLPYEQNLPTIHVVIHSAIVITITHLCLLLGLKLWTGKSFSSCSKGSYRGTNLLVNTFLGCYGAYLCLFVQEWSFPLSSVPIYDKIAGYDQYSHFPGMQIGYNLWALPVGIFLIGEDWFMIVHHIATIFVATPSGFSNTGFRLHAPYLLGVIELSSIPLAFYNYFKDHKEWTTKHCPGLYNLCKLLFAVSFILLRVVIGSRHMFEVTKNAFLLVWTATGLSWRVFWCSGYFIFALCLIFLQYFWGFLIMKGVASVFLSKKSIVKREKSD